MASASSAARRTVGLAGRQESRIAGAGRQEDRLAGPEIFQDLLRGQHRQRATALCGAGRLIKMHDHIARRRRDARLDRDQAVDVAAHEGKLFESGGRRGHEKFHSFASPVLRGRWPVGPEGESPSRDAC
jgi:hypothetical protein